MAAPSRKLGSDRSCEVCGGVFYASRARASARFCSRACKGVGSRKTFTCETCGTESYSFRNRQKRWCGRTCASLARRNGRDVTCAGCSSTFYLARTRAETASDKFCSNSCHNEWQGRNKTDHTCKVCGEEFRWSPSRTASGKCNVTYCSQTCRDADPEMVAKWVANSALLQDRRTTRAEQAGYAILDNLGIPYQRQAPLNGKFTPDALIPSAAIMVQFDGDYWHDRAGTSTEPRIRRRVALDRSQDAYARACGWEVVRLWETDLRDDPAGCEAQIRRHLRPPS